MEAKGKMEKACSLYYEWKEEGLPDAELALLLVILTNLADEVEETLEQRINDREER